MIAFVVCTSRFTGKERDAESGIDYFGTRYYGSALGRFTSPDPKLLTARHLLYPQKWNKYAYVRNNPLISIDPDGQDDFYVFRPVATNTPVSWQAAQANAAKNGNTLTIYNGKDATAVSYADALQQPGAHIVFSGHSVDDASGNAGSVMLSDKAVGQLGSFVNPDGSGGLIPPAGTPPASAADVAVFACTSNDLGSQYSTTFTGTSSIGYIPSLDAGAAAYTDTLVRNGTIDQASAAAQKSMSATDARVSDTDKPPTPQVCTTTDGKTTCH